MGGPETTQGMQWVKQGKAVLLMQVGVNQGPRYADVPNIMDTRNRTNKRPDAAFVHRPGAWTPFLRSARCAMDRARRYRRHSSKTMDDPDFKKEAADQQIDLSPLFAADMPDPS